MMLYKEKLCVFFLFFGIEYIHAFMKAQRRYSRLSESGGENFFIFFFCVETEKILSFRAEGHKAAIT